MEGGGGISAVGVENEMTRSAARDSTPIEKVFLHEPQVKLMMRNLAGERRCGSVVK